MFSTSGMRTNANACTKCGVIQTPLHDRMLCARCFDIDEATRQLREDLEVLAEDNLRLRDALERAFTLLEGSVNHPDLPLSSRAAAAMGIMRRAMRGE